MSQTLGGVTLDHDMIWIDHKASGQIISSQYVSLKGTDVIQSVSKTGWYNITLEANSKTGWLKGDTIDSLWALANVEDATYTLNLNGTEYTVRFRTEDYPCIDMHLQQDHSNADDNTDYIGTIKLRKV